METMTEINMSTPNEVGASELVKVSYAATMLGVSQTTVRRLIKRGVFKPNRSLRHLLIPRIQINEFIKR